MDGKPVLDLRRNDIFTKPDRKLTRIDPPGAAAAPLGADAAQRGNSPARSDISVGSLGRAPSDMSLAAGPTEIITYPAGNNGKALMRAGNKVDPGGRGAGFE